MIVHTFTTRAQGDMKNSVENRKKVVQKLFGEDREILMMAQKHTSKIGTDALISSRKDVAAAVFAADCVPILLSDNTMFAVIHAGWRGTLGGITKKTVLEMKQNGAGEIHAWIGPHIGMCHYDVPEERAKKFQEAFGSDVRVASFFEGKWHVDLGWANYMHLLTAGVKKEHIKAPPTCTYCQSDTYFSFRKEKNELEGEIMGIIGKVNQ